MSRGQGGVNWRETIGPPPASENAGPPGPWVLGPGCPVALLGPQSRYLVVTPPEIVQPSAGIVQPPAGIVQPPPGPLESFSRPLESFSRPLASFSRQMHMR